jgi:hypothetical protein
MYTVLWERHWEYKSPFRSVPSNSPSAVLGPQIVEPDRAPNHFRRISGPRRRLELTQPLSGSSGKPETNLRTRRWLIRDFVASRGHGRSRYTTQRAP